MMRIPGLALTNMLGAQLKSVGTEPPTPTDPKPGYIMYEDFTIAPQGSGLDGRVPNVKAVNGGSWTSDTTGTFIIQSGSLRVNVVNRMSQYEIGTNDLFEIEMTSANDNVLDRWLAMAFAANTYNNFVEVRWDFSRARVFCRVRSNGSWTFVAQQGGVTFNPGDKLRCKVEGTNLRVFVNGTAVTTFVVSASFLRATTSVGLATYQNDNGNTPMISDFGVKLL